MEEKTGWNPIPRAFPDEKPLTLDAYAWWTWHSAAPPVLPEDPTEGLEPVDMPATPEERRRFAYSLEASGKLLLARRLAANKLASTPTTVPEPPPAENIHWREVLKRNAEKKAAS